jgi:Ca2+-binding RTX toxin-like protein
MATIIGGAAADTLDGADGVTSGADSVFGDAGNDVLFGLAGSDTLDGGTDYDTLDGGADNDSLSGGAENDLAYGGAGADTLNGGNGSDFLYGGAGADLLDGGGNTTGTYGDAVSYQDATAGVRVTLDASGSGTGEAGDAAGDTLVGINVIFGSAFADTLGGSARVLQGEGGDDLLTLTAPDGISIGAVGGSGNDTIIVGDGTYGFVWGDLPSEYTGTGFDLLDFGLVTGTVAGSFAFGSIPFFGSARGGFYGFEAVAGGLGADNFSGLDGGQSMMGRGGNDTLSGDGGNDTLEGGAGSDSLNAGLGIDEVSYAGDTVGVAVNLATLAVSGGDAQGDTITGDFENARGGTGADTLVGTTGANLLSGGNGADSLSGGTGADTLQGGAGADRLDGGGDLGDAASYQDATAGVRVTLSASGQGTGEAGDAAGDTLVGIALIIGSALADTLGGSGDEFRGEDGDDLITLTPGGAFVEGAIGGAGNDTIVVGDGTYSDLEGDRFFSAVTDGFDLLDFGLVTGTMAGTFGIGSINFFGSADANVSGFEAVAGGLAADSFQGVDGGQSLMGRGGNDTLDGRGGNDTLDGGDGNDRLVGDVGTAGDDVLKGGAGSDTLVSAGGSDSLDGGDGIDIADYSGASGKVIINLVGGLVTKDPNLLAGTNAGVDSLTGIEVVIGTAFGEAITGGAQAETLAGDGGNDLIDGGVGADCLMGGAGNDQITVAGGDTADGGDGADGLVFGGAVRVDAVAGAATMAGETIRFSLFETYVLSAADDVFLGSGAAENVQGGAGQDSLFGGGGADMLIAGTGRDTVEGGAGADTMETTGGDDELSYASDVGGVGMTIDGVTAGIFGDAAGDLAKGFLILRGGSGNDSLQAAPIASTLIGGAGEDRLLGGAGADSLSGGTFNDLIVGGSGADTLLGGDGGDSLFGESTIPDIFHGFSLEDDLVEVLEGGKGADLLSGGTFVDEASYAGDTIGVLVSLVTGTGSGGDAQGDTLLGDIENLRGGSGADTLLGNNEYNYLTGGLGNDSLDAGGGPDILEGGQGADTLRGSDNRLAIASYAGSGEAVTAVIRLVDGVVATTLAGGDAEGDRLFNLAGVFGSAFGDTLGGAAVFGGAGNDLLFGFGSAESFLLGEAGDDTLTGGAAAETVSGGDGVDELSYASDTVGVQVDLGAGSLGGGDAQGDGFAVDGDGVLLKDIENLRGGSGNDTLTGDTLANVLAGGLGNDTLSGQGGSDTLEGGAGADTLNGGDGLDFASYAHSATAVTVVLDFAGFLAAATVAGGDAQGDFIFGVEGVIGSDFGDTLGGVVVRGGAGNDLLRGTTTIPSSLFGEAGNDTLLGGNAAETLSGGEGLDELSYANDTVGVYVSLADDQVGGSFGGLAEGDVAFDIEILRGGAGSDTLISNNSWATTMIGGAGDDIIEGWIEDDVLLGEAGDDRLHGIEGDNSLSGGDGDDFLLSINGANTMEGGAGRDLLLGEVAADDPGRDLASYAGSAVGVRVVVDAAGNGFGFGGDAEGDTLDGMDALLGSSLGDTLQGRDLDGGLGADSLQGIAGADTLVGGGGADTLAGAGGADSMLGGAGNDLYVVQGADILAESIGGGADTVRADATWSLGAEIEDLLLLGTATHAGSGNASANRIAGNGVANVLSGFGGADTLRGEGGADSLVGGGGNDRLEGGAGNDTMAGGANDDTYVVTDAGDVVTEIAGGGADTILASVSATIAAEVELLALQGAGNLAGTGNAAANRIVGNTGANLLSGLDAADTLDGGEGNDSLAGGSGADSLAGGFGADSLAGGADNDTLLGQDGADTLRGGAGTDSLGGGLGLDLLVAAGGDTLAGGDGADTVSYAEATGPVRVDLALGGATLAGGNDRLQAIEAAQGGAFADTLIGAAGAQTLIGGAGDDLHVLQDVGDVAVEAAGGGSDWVQALASLTLGAEIERLTLLGAASLDGGGNTLANLIEGNGAANRLSGFGGADTLSGGGSADTLAGGGGADSLNGGSGADSMAGGADGDFYVVDNALDAILELDGGGYDQVVTALQLTLGAFVERLTLTGTAGLSLTGNELGNRLDGNNGANLLLGRGGDDILFAGGGNDTLQGGQGRDRMEGGDGQNVYRWNAASEGGDTINSYVPANGQIEVSAAGFGGGLVAGVLGADRLVAGAGAAAAANQAFGQFLLDTTTNTLRWDADGTGGGAAVDIVRMPNLGPFTAAEIVVF